MNIWKRQQEQQDQSPGAVRKRAKRAFFSALFWTAGAGIILILLFIAWFSGAFVMDLSTGVLLLILLAYFVISIPTVLARYREMRSLSSP